MGEVRNAHLASNPEEARNLVSSFQGYYAFNSTDYCNTPSESSSASLAAPSTGATTTSSIVVSPTAKSTTTPSTISLKCYFSNPDGKSEPFNYELLAPAGSV